MLKVMKGFEKQLMDYASREEQITNLAGQSKKVEQAMLERDQAQAREVQSRREIARLLEQRREQATKAAAQERRPQDMRAHLLAQLDAGREHAELSERCPAPGRGLLRGQRGSTGEQAGPPPGRLGGAQAPAGGHQVESHEAVSVAMPPR